MILSAAMHRHIAHIAAGIDALNEGIGRALAWFLPTMVAITLFIIIAGALFRSGWAWVHESVTYLHAALFTLAAAHTLLHDAHVRIDVLYSRLSAAGQSWVNMCGACLLLIPFCIAVIVLSFGYVQDSWQVLERSAEGQGLPAVFLLKTCIPVMALLLLLQGVSMAAKALPGLLPPPR